MTNKYALGNSFVYFSDKYGTMIDKKPCINYMDGRQMIYEYEKKNPGASGVMLRVIYNSKDKHSYEPNN